MRLEQVIPVSSMQWLPYPEVAHWSAIDSRVNLGDMTENGVTMVLGYGQTGVELSNIAARRGDGVVEQPTEAATEHTFTENLGVGELGELEPKAEPGEIEKW